MNRVVLYPYKIKSASARLIQEELINQGVSCIRVYPDGNYRPREDDLIIGWGNSNEPRWIHPKSNQVDYHSGEWFLNSPGLVTAACNKLTTFSLLKEAGISIPEYTTDVDIAKTWNSPVIARTTLTGRSGLGCYFFESLFDVENVEWNDRPVQLWVKYIKKTAEYRVHVFKGEIIDVQQKRKKRNFQGEIDTKIRSHNRGWVYCRDSIILPESIPSLCINAISSLGLDFGAVDVIWNNHYQKAYVLEVNSAPGLEGKTVLNYVDAIKKLL